MTKKEKTKLTIIKDRFGKDIQIQKNVILKETSIYKPLLIVFGLSLIAQIILFNNTVFDSMNDPIPSILNYIRLAAAAMVSSAATVLIILPIPVTFSDAFLFLQYNIANSIIYTGGFVLITIAADILWAYVGYKFTSVFRRLFARKASNRDVKSTNSRLSKYGNAAVLLFAATPLPFTVAVYAAGALKLNLTYYLLAVSVGRFIRHGFFFLLIEVSGLTVNQFIEIITNLFTVLV
jgi:membrane protein YqaA with SNARE-associated domain